jgi:hypothetical protein
MLHINAYELCRSVHYCFGNKTPNPLGCSAAGPIRILSPRQRPTEAKVSSSKGDRSELLIVEYQVLKETIILLVPESASLYCLLKDQRGPKLV